MLLFSILLTVGLLLFLLTLGTAPTPTARTSPTGFLLREGFKSTITFASKPSIQLWEKEVKPAGMDVGDGIDISNMHNTQYMTFRPRALKKIGQATMVCGYDPDVYSDILAILGAETTITETYPDAATLCYYGCLLNFERQPLKIGEFPLANVTILCTNWDVSAKVEAGPVYTASSGT